MGHKSDLDLSAELRNETYLDIFQGIDLQTISDRPILDIAARFWDDERYKAANKLYLPMRVIDDLVDNRRIDGKISETEKQQLIFNINEWVEAVTKYPENPLQQQMNETIRRFKVPLWTIQAFSESMIYDIHNDSFGTFSDFLRYSEGAAVATGSIFAHFCGINKEGETYSLPGFDIQKATRPMAIFSYLVHIFRDFQKDMNNNLNYFADDLIAENGLNLQILRDIAAGGEIRPGFRELMEKYYTYTEYYRSKARGMLDEILIYLDPRYQLSLEVLYNLYLQIFERIDVENGRFTTEELCPSPEEIKERVNMVVSSFRPKK